MRAHALPLYTSNEFVEPNLRASQKKNHQNEMESKSRDCVKRRVKRNERMSGGVHVCVKTREEKGKVEQIFESCGSFSNLGTTNLTVFPM